MDTNDNKRGFSGLSELASDVSFPNDVSSPEPSSPSPQPTQHVPKPTGGSETSTSPKTIETVGSGKIGWGSGWKWILGIIAVIFVIWLANNGEQNAKNPSYNPPSPTHRSYDYQSNRSILAQEIKYGKTRAKQMETQLKNTDERLKDYERRMRSYRASGMRDEYNRLVPSFNSLVRERNDLYEEYSRLIDEINSKVSRYNLGSR